jgi:pyridoxamine 5'-phosphate oxidase
MNILEKLKCLLTFGQGVALPLPDISSETNPIILFEHWFNDAKKSGILLPESMSISTCDKNGQPHSRMVLLKEFTTNGFIFYTNYGSNKSQELNANNKIAILFHWNVLQRQIRIEGEVSKTSSEQSQRYFHSRDRGSQIGAWASKQSHQITTPTELKDRETYYKNKFSNLDAIPYPEFWGGWNVKPTYIEFWQGRSNRLHDRVCFKKQGDDWTNFKRHP